jgi:hypothetical protein
MHCEGTKNVKATDISHILCVLCGENTPQLVGPVGEWSAVCYTAAARIAAPRAGAPDAPMLY